MSFSQFGQDIRNMGQKVLELGKAAKTYAQTDERAIRATRKVQQLTHKAGKYVGEANIAGRDALFTAKRTINASQFSGKSLGYHAFVGTGIGAGLGVANAYGNNDDPLRGAIKGGLYGAGIGAATGIGRSLYKGYGLQAGSRIKGYSHMAGPVSRPMPIPSMVRPAGPLKYDGSWATSMDRLNQVL